MRLCGAKQYSSISENLAFRCFPDISFKGKECRVLAATENQSTVNPSPISTVYA
jgi:hypothetical protein